MQNISELVPGMNRSGSVTPIPIALGLPVFCVFAAVLIGSFPLQASIVSVFLFAGVHNFMEFRYFFARMPVRWGRSTLYYSFGIGGTLVLTAAYLGIYFGGGNWLWSLIDWQIGISVWNTALVFWIGFLVFLKKRKKWNSGESSLLIAVIFLFTAAAWILPAYWNLSLVYLHPLIALWFLDRQIVRSKPQWLRCYRSSLCVIPVVLVLLWFVLAGSSDLPVEKTLFWRIAQHAGSQILPGISSHLLVASHVFLETIHYGVWILLIPLADKRAIPWRIKEIPFFSNMNGFPKLAAAALAAGVLMVAGLWLGFYFDYTATRDIYFAFAIGHVVAEVPFLVRMV